MRPDIAIANGDGTSEIREMTEEEYQALLDSGWTPDAPRADSPSDAL